MPQSASLDRVRSLIGRGVTLLDVLHPKEYERTHLPGAINIPLRKLDRAASAQFHLDKPLVVYCYDAL